jgi:hypothetical protein
MLGQASPLNGRLHGGGGRNECEGVVGLLGKADAVITNMKTQLVAFTLEFLDITFAGFGETVERREDAHSGLAVQATNVRTGTLRPYDIHYDYSRCLLQSFGVRPKSASTSSWEIP